MNIYMKAMKNKLVHTAIKVHHVFLIPFVIGTFIFSTGATAQESKDSATKLPVSMHLNPIVSNGERTMKVLITRKENKKTIYVGDIRSPLNLYLSEAKDYEAATGTGWMSKSSVNNEGEALFTFPAWFKQVADTVHEYTFIVKMEADPKYEDTEEQITIADARIELEYSGDDSVKTASGIVTGWKEGAYLPAAGAELKLGIKRVVNGLQIPGEIYNRKVR